MTAVSFRSADRTLAIPGRTGLKRFIARLFTRERTPLEGITYIFCSDAFLLKLNHDYLGHDTYTDILTFGLSGATEPVVAEVYISIDRVKDNAGAESVTYREEMLRVIFHGALHLCGYRDKKKSEITIMRKKEDQYLRLFAKYENA